MEEAAPGARSGVPVGRIEVALGGADLGAQEVEGGIDLGLGPHLVRLAHPVDGREVEGVERVLGDELEPPGVAVERAEARDAAADGPGENGLGELGEVALGVGAAERVEGQAGAREEGAEVSEVGPVGPQGVGGCPSARGACAGGRGGAASSNGSAVSRVALTGRGAVGARRSGRKRVGGRPMQVLCWTRPAVRALRQRSREVQIAAYRPFTPIRVSAYTGSERPVASPKKPSPY